MPPSTRDDTSLLENARERLYDETEQNPDPHHPLLVATDKRELPHTWNDNPLQYLARRGGRQVHLAGIFFAVAFLFFLIAVGIAGYFFYFGGNAVSVDKISVEVQGPTTIAGGEAVPLSFTITNKNAVAIKDAIIEIDFPTGTRDAADVLAPYPRYLENLGTMEPGATVTRSVKAIVFGGAGQALTFPISFSYGTAGSNATFVKDASYMLTISTTPLSVSVDTLTEAVSGQPLTLTLTVASNSTVPLNNVVLTGALPFGFTVTSSSLPLSNSSFFIGTLLPGERSTITLTGTLTGQDSEERVFRFTAGTAKTANDQELAVTYMTQDAVVTITAPFIHTTLALNGNTAPNVVVTPGSLQSMTVSYTNTLSTSVTNATVIIAISGSAVDYNSVKSANGFYNSADRTIVFSKDTDPALSTLAPGASGIGTFTFSTLPMSALAPSSTITLTTSVSGTRVGQSNVPEQVRSSAVKTAKVATTVVFSAASLHTSGPLATSGPIPPHPNEATTYTVQWQIQNQGSAVAGGIVSATLPSYVTYTDLTSGRGTFSYNEASRMVSWNTGDLAQGASAQGAFQISFMPSISQKGSVPSLTGIASFSGYDRFAGVQISVTADPVTTETPRDPGYSPTNGTVQ